LVLLVDLRRVRETHLPELPEEVMENDIVNTINNV